MKNKIKYLVFLFLSLLLCIVNAAEKNTNDYQLNSELGFSRLSRLSNFEDVVVIQKRFLPRTKRFELSGALNAILNDAFYTSLGVQGRFGYNFTEAYGIEATAMNFSTSEREVIKSLRDTPYTLYPEETFVTAKSFMGLSFKWTPIYGKLSYNDQSITPYDFYFSGGFGTTKTNHDKNEPSLFLGTGQTYALSKSSAFRWDFGLTYYKAHVVEKERNAAQVVISTEEKTLATYNLFISVGMSFFFPEASYR